MADYKPRRKKKYEDPKKHRRKGAEIGINTSWFNSCLEAIKKWDQIADPLRDELLLNLDRLDLNKKEWENYLYGKLEPELRVKMSAIIKRIEQDAKELNQIQERENILLQMLDSEEKQSQYLDLGHIEKEGVWYYGVILDGKDTLILSDKRHFQNKKTKKGGEDEIKGNLFDYDSSLGDVAPFWRKKSILEFIQGRTVDKIDVYKRIKEQLDYFMDYLDRDIQADILTCWIIATYIYPIFYWFAHILFNGPSGSGKSKNGDLLTSLCFRGFDLGTSGGATGPQIYRALEGNRGTCKIDEFERNEKSESYQTVTKILNAGAARESYVIRNEQRDKKWVSWKFPIFSPKIVCNITGINPTSLSRFIVIPLLKTIGEKGKRKPYKQKYQGAFKQIRDDCHILIMQHYQEILQICDEMDVELSNREEDNWLAVLTIARFIDEELFKVIETFIRTKYEGVDIAGDDPLERFFLKLYQNVPSVEQQYTPKIMSEWFQEDDIWYSPAKIGRTLSQFQFKWVRTGRGKNYFISKPKIEDILRRYFPSTISAGCVCNVGMRDSEEGEEEKKEYNGTDKDTQPTQHTQTNNKQEPTQQAQPTIIEEEIVDE